MWFFFIILNGVRLSPLGTAPTTGLLYQPQMIDDGDCGVFNVWLLSRCLVTNLIWITLQLLNPRTMNLEESLVSRILYLDLWVPNWNIFMRTEYITVDSFLLFSVSSVATKTCDILRATLWFIPAYSLPRKHVLASRCNGNFVFT
jgi:hypothetical protein